MAVFLWIFLTVVVSAVIVLIADPTKNWLRLLSRPNDWLWLLSRRKKVKSASKLNRLYIAELYEWLNRGLVKKRNVNVSVEDIEERVVRGRPSKALYTDIAEAIIRQLEAVLGIKLRYYEKAAIDVRQAERFYQRPMFREERAYLLYARYEPVHGPIRGYWNIGYFTGRWDENRYAVVSAEGEVRSFTKKKRPPGVYIPSAEGPPPQFIVRPSHRIPPIVTKEYSMGVSADRRKASFSSDTAVPADKYIEFPPGVSEEELKAVLERSAEQKRERKRLLEAAYKRAVDEEK